MLKKSLSITFLILLFGIFLFFYINDDKVYQIVEIVSPVEFILDNGNIIHFKDLDTFDSAFTLHNKKLANNLKISEVEAFVLGNLAQYQALNLMKGRKVLVKDSDFIFLKYSYKIKFLYSGFCIRNLKPYNTELFEKKLSEVRKSKFKVLDLESDKIYDLNDEKVRTLKDFILIRKSHISKISLDSNMQNIATVFENGDIKILLSDLTTKLKPDRECSSDICREILTGINMSKNTIDMAIYGYSKTPAIEEALKNALKRGVKIRLVYDTDANGKNIYPDTNSLVKILEHNRNDANSKEVQNIMHNKFYIFDDKILITGSANLSHTDMSGFNSNSIVVLNSEEVSKIYKTEFEQMFRGKFHNDKTSFKKSKVYLSNAGIQIYFSPQDKSITNAILPLIRQAKQYIYIPTFVLTEKRVTEELIKASNRGVEVKIIIDALNASVRHSKHKELRDGGILVKTENYAGKMHSKSMIVDDEYTIVGSMNFSNSGENRNDENLIVIKSPQIAKFYKEFFLSQWDKIDNKWLKLNARAEGTDSIGSCSDGIDNNYDKLIDADDAACHKTP